MKKLVAALAVLFLLAGCSESGAGGDKPTVPRPETIATESSQAEVTGETDPTDPDASASSQPSDETAGESGDGGSGGEGDHQTQSGSTETGGGSSVPGGGSGSGGGSDGSSGSDSTSSGGNTGSDAAPDDGFVHLASNKLTVTSFGRYSGAYVEDGSDEPVTDVAVILVRNDSTEYLSYACLTFDIDGKAAQFILTGLPAGSGAWVLEANRTTAAAGALFTAVDEISTFDETSMIPGVAVTPNDGSLTVRNDSGKALSEGYVYYKLLHTDGNFLGGITYRTPVGDLGAGETANPTAGHSKADGCVVVRVTSNDE